MDLDITINENSSIRIKDQKIIYFDPYKIKTLKNDADLIFITHDHFDHFDIESIKKILNKDTKIIVPEAIKTKILTSNLNLEQVIFVSKNKTYNFLNYQVETIPSYNLETNYHPKEANYLGYIITINKTRIYVAGDTSKTLESENVKCDIALVPIGGTYTMDYKEASELINKIKPRIAIPTHYNSVCGNMEDAYKFQKNLDSNIKCLILIK